MLGAMNQGMRALGVAKGTYLRINGERIMCVQHQVCMDRCLYMYVSLYMCMYMWIYLFEDFI